MIEKVLGKNETAKVTTSATSIYNALFVETGMVKATNKAMVTEEEKAHSESMFGQSVRGISDRTNDYLLGVSALCFASLVRIVIFIAWLPYIAPFSLQWFLMHRSADGSSLRPSDTRVRSSSPWLRTCSLWSCFFRSSIWWRHSRSRRCSFHSGRLSRRFR